MKLHDIDTLLALPHEADIDLWSVPLETIKELERFHGGEMLYSEVIHNHWLTLNSDKVTLTLNTKKK